ncbi:MAG: DUF5678 domain-containing protein [Dehalococcoidia bacterium]
MTTGREKLAARWYDGLMDIRDEDLKLANKTLRENREKYRGHHVLVVRDKVFAAKSGEKAEEIYHELERKYPDIPPLITYIPKEDTLILWS